MKTSDINLREEREELLYNYLNNDGRHLTKTEYMYYTHLFNREYTITFKDFIKLHQVHFLLKKIDKQQEVRLEDVANIQLVYNTDEDIDVSIMFNFLIDYYIDNKDLLLEDNNYELVNKYFNIKNKNK